MKKLTSMLVAICVVTLALAAPAQAAFGLHAFNVSFTNRDGTAAEAGSHPFAMTTAFGANLTIAEGRVVPEGWLKSLSLRFPPGLVADTTAYPRCTTAEFLDVEGGGQPPCSLSTQVGITAVSARDAGVWSTYPVFNLTPPPGVLARFGFHIVTQNVFIDIGLNSDPPYNGVATLRNVPQLLDFYASKTQIWGNPSDPRHDELRGECGNQSTELPPEDTEGFEFEETGESCPVPANPKPFLTLGTDCSGPLTAGYEAVSWNDLDHDDEAERDAGAIQIPALGGCGKLGFHSSIDAKPTSRGASSPTGLDFSLDVDDEGLTNPEDGARAQSHIRRVVATLPEGMTLNPSQAEGLEVCSEEDLRRETLQAGPGEGCPEASKIGTVEVESPLVDERVKGALFVATPHENLAGDSLIAAYLVLKNAKLGIIAKQPLRVEPDPRTGQLITIADEIPQLPFSFRLHFREGGRSPLVTPPLCGDYEVVARMTPRSGGAPFSATSSFQIISGRNEDPCPEGGTPPFEPGFEAGSQSNAAGHFSSFLMRLTRRDGDQDLTRFDATLPRGVAGVLAGIDKCPDAQISLAKVKTGIAELRSPSCPANSRLGTVQAGAGVGSQLTYVPGSLYLAGPFGGAPISVVGIVPAVAGPFDVGTVVARFALKINPRTGEVSTDGAHSDPIPHILAGIPLVVRDIQVSVDRPNFTFNPTSCDPFATRAAIWGGGADPFEQADDSPVAKEARYQAASCLSLGFKPTLSLKLTGGTRRGAFPKFHFAYRPRSGDANLQDIILRFPHSEFVEQGHFRTICTRVQFAAGAGNGAACPKGSIYGRARVFTPVLSEPLEGPVFLRSSDHNLPDAVLALEGPPGLAVQVEVPVRIDSLHGGLRASGEQLPDVPVSKAVVNMLGGQKGLFVNSTNLCLGKHRANARLEAQNSKRRRIRPVMHIRCPRRR